MLPSASDRRSVVAAVEAFCGVPVRSWHDLGGSGSTNLALRTDARVLVARLHAPGTPAERVLAEQHLRGLAADAGLPTVRAEALLRLPDGRPLELEPYVDAPGRMRTPDTLLVGVELLGRLHDVLAACPPSPADQPAQTPNHVASGDAAAATARGCARLAGWSDPELRAFGADVRDHVERVVELEAPLVADQVVQLAHGDFWDDNVRFDGPRCRAILDFGFLGRRARVDDLALTFWFWLLEPGHGRAEAADRQLLVDLAAAYDRGTERPLSAAERAALPLAVARQPAWSVGRHVVELGDQDAQAHARAAALELPVARAVLAQLPLWLAALGAGGV